jgi:hypothetical protein
MFSFGEFHPRVLEMSACSIHLHPPAAPLSSLSPLASSCEPLSPSLDLARSQKCRFLSFRLVAHSCDHERWRRHTAFHLCEQLFCALFSATARRERERRNNGLSLSLSRSRPVQLTSIRVAAYAGSRGETCIVMGRMLRFV